MIHEISKQDTIKIRAINKMDLILYILKNINEKKINNYCSLIYIYIHDDTTNNNNSGDDLENEYFKKKITIPKIFFFISFTISIILIL